MKRKVQFYSIFVCFFFRKSCTQKMKISENNFVCILKHQEVLLFLFYKIKKKQKKTLENIVNICS